MDKSTVRARVLDRRRERSSPEREDYAHAIAHHVCAMPEVVQAKTVACYLSLPTEPGTHVLIDELLERGVRVIAPIASQWTMTWRDVSDRPNRVVGEHGVPEPQGGESVEIVAADLLLVPGLAVDAAGRRLGRGGGYYDRLLNEVDIPACVLLFADEILETVPTEEHDHPVQMVATELGVSHLGVF